MPTNTLKTQNQTTTQAEPAAPQLPPRSRLLSPKETAATYGISLRALKRAWADRRLRYYRTGYRTILLDPRDIEDYLGRCRIDALRA